MKRVMVLGGAGFIGVNLVAKLKSMGYYVVVADKKTAPEFGWKVEPDRYVCMDLKWLQGLRSALSIYDIDDVYQLAANMGGAGFIFTGDHDKEVLMDNLRINLNVAHAVDKCGVNRLFYSSSACIYPKENQTDVHNPDCRECTAYPANPDSEYGWEKLISERIYQVLSRDSNVAVRIARYHNVYGPYGAYKGGREKSPAAMIRKAITSESEMEIWGDGEQTRSFLYVDDCTTATIKLMESNCNEIVNIGSEEMVTINTLAKIAQGCAGRKLPLSHIPGPVGVRGRCSNNDFVRKLLDWEPSISLADGMMRTYDWIAKWYA